MRTLLPAVLLSLPLLALTGCKEEGYSCTATISQGGMVTDTRKYDYPDAASADDAVEECNMDVDADPPTGSYSFECKCESK
jgi:hypothetical protein